MKRNFLFKIKPLLILFFSLSLCNHLQAQTDIDGIMMEKNAFCVGPMYSYTSWKSYWEGTLKRQNLNLGTVSTQMFSGMGIYGITRKLNILFNVPYVKTNASAGTLHGVEGMQDMSLFIKWRPYQKRMGDGRLSVFGIAGLSFPLSNYQADYLPLALGLHTVNALARIMADYQQGNLFATLSGTYIRRSNVTIDRNSYYTTEQYETNKVQMPDAASFNIRAGYRTQWLIAEAVLNNWYTLGGFDITRNNMPFPSNRMNAGTAGINIKYVLKFLPQLSIVGGGSHTISGRNIGQSTEYYGSLFYVLDLNKKNKTSPVQTNF